VLNLINGANDLIAFKFDISLNVMTWIGRIGSVVLPVIAYIVTYRICIGLQHSDRAILEHGIETGIIRRLPTGEFIEVHQPLNGTDDHGHPIPLAYQGAAVPKKMNQLGAAGEAMPGWLAPKDNAGVIEYHSDPAELEAGSDADTDAHSPAH
jgi:ubiquinol-cytochrome c reductase cytochrome b subunit